MQIKNNKNHQFSVAKIQAKLEAKYYSVNN